VRSELVISAGGIRSTFIAPALYCAWVTCPGDLPVSHLQNQEVFERDSVVAFYVAAASLFPAEQALFATLIRPTDRVLDLGIGAGRTTPWLSENVAEYTGTDISRAMVDAARLAHPNVDIRVGDATDLSEFPDDHFDVVVFSFNGIDCLSSDGRQSCLREINRVLARGGRLILSRHNPRCIVATAKTLRGVGWKVIVFRLATAWRQTGRLAGRRLTRPSFWTGTGLEFDPAHGGLRLELASPKRCVNELRTLGFDVLRGPLHPDHPTKFRWWKTHWYYVAAVIRASTS
jgi:SAM-dependent methyltransferase